MTKLPGDDLYSTRDFLPEGSLVLSFCSRTFTTSGPFDTTKFIRLIGCTTPLAGLGARCLQIGRDCLGFGGGFLKECPTRKQQLVQGKIGLCQRTTRRSGCVFEIGPVKESEDRSSPGIAIPLPKVPSYRQHPCLWRRGPSLVCQQHRLALQWFSLWLRVHPEGRPRPARP